MKCPYCNKDLPSITCPECQESIPEESRYCLYCGAYVLNTTIEDEAATTPEEADNIDFEDRIPCPDGNCIGIIVNGKCNVCGKRYKGKAK